MTRTVRALLIGLSTGAGVYSITFSVPASMHTTILVIAAFCAVASGVLTWLFMGTVRHYRILRDNSVTVEGINDRARGERATVIDVVALDPGVLRVTLTPLGTDRTAQYELLVRPREERFITKCCIPKAPIHVIHLDGTQCLGIGNPDIAKCVILPRAS